jgi:hypothetical protein
MVREHDLAQERQHGVFEKAAVERSHRECILSPLQGEVAFLIENHKVGFRYGTDSGTSLVGCIETLISNQALRHKLSNNAQMLYREKFSYEMVYGDLVRHLEMIARSRRMH